MREEIERAFWKAFLGAVSYDRWYKSASNQEKIVARHYLDAVVAKIGRGREFNECVTAGASALKTRLDQERTQLELLSKHEWEPV